MDAARAERVRAIDAERRHERAVLDRGREAVEQRADRGPAWTPS